MYKKEILNSKDMPVSVLAISVGICSILHFTTSILEWSEGWLSTLKIHVKIKAVWITLGGASSPFRWIDLGFYWKFNFKILIAMVNILSVSMELSWDLKSFEVLFKSRSLLVWVWETDGRGYMHELCVLTNSQHSKDVCLTYFCVQLEDQSCWLKGLPLWQSPKSPLCVPPSILFPCPLAFPFLPISPCPFTLPLPCSPPPSPFLYPSLALSSPLYSPFVSPSPFISPLPSTPHSSPPPLSYPFISPSYCETPTLDHFKPCFWL